jgi:hypothetical protein
MLYFIAFTICFGLRSSLVKYVKCGKLKYLNNNFLYRVYYVTCAARLLVEDRRSWCTPTLSKELSPPGQRTAQLRDTGTKKKAVTVDRTRDFKMNAMSKKGKIAISHSTAELPLQIMSNWCSLQFTFDYFFSFDYINCW